MQKRFLAVNTARLDRARASLTARQRDFLELLPLLFHSNHATLPGYVSKETPSGICDYDPGPRELALAQRLARSFGGRRMTPQAPAIAGLYAMGSPGSIGYAQGSDVDVWLCHEPGLPPGRVAELAEKARRIERWAAESGLDLHFFVFDAPGFRAGRSLSLSSESSGSSQHSLLLDEFYRSGLVLAGACPLWWLVPPGHDGDYDAWAAELTRRRYLGTLATIDFGGLARIPAEEFFGATVWQLSKSITSPYKSVLKLLLMEVYADEFPGIDLLSQRYKRAIYGGTTDLDTLDPYLQMYAKIEEYLMARGDSERLDLLRRCFYLKVDERLTQPRADGAPAWRRELLERLVLRWGWEHGRLALLDTRDRWRVEVVQGERRDLVAALTQSYRCISQFARAQSQVSRISQDDLSVLGRKLYAAFERKAGKIDLVNRGIGADVSEPRLSLHEVPVDGDGSAWTLHRGSVTPAEASEASLLKRGRSAIEALAWADFNGLVAPDTTFSIASRDGEPDAREVRLALAALDEQLHGAGGDPEFSDFASAPRLRAAALFTNFGRPPLRETMRQGAHLTTSHADALRYGGQRHNLAQTFDLVLTNSWGEVFAFHHAGAAGLVATLCEWLHPALACGTLQAPATNCFNSGYGSLVATRITTLFSDVLEYFHAASGGSRRRYVLELEGVFHVLEAEDGIPRAQSFDGLPDLLRALERSSPRYARTAFDRGSALDTPLPAIFAANRRGVVQLFLQQHPGTVEAWVADERGSLFHQRLPGADLVASVDHYARLFATVMQRLSPPTDGRGAYSTEFHLLTRHGQGWRLATLEAPSTSRSRYFNVQVIGDVGPNGGTFFSVFCDDEEFSSLEHGARVFEAAGRHVLSKRLSGLQYPIYITDVDLSPALLARQGVEELQTVHLLGYKRTIEGHLNRVLRER